MRYLVRFVHLHETFRLPELEALAVVHGIKIRVLSYTTSSPFGIVELQDEASARLLISRAILVQDIYELWADAENYTTLHEVVRAECDSLVDRYRHASFRFNVDAFQSKPNPTQKQELIESFSYLDLRGSIVMRDPDIQMCVFEDHDHRVTLPKHVYLGRWIARSNRDAIVKYDLKKRRYISRTSMDAELSLVTANLTMAAPGKLVFDPFVGTGSFAVTSAHYGAMALGADIDPRSIRGNGSDRNLLSNFDQYHTMHNFLDNFICDLVHCPLRSGRLFDGIICDPPYGVREGPKTLGYREGKSAEIVYIDGVPAHLRDGFLAPKRPYGFNDMMLDILDFACDMLVDHGRLSMWMPTANDEDVELAIPQHPGLRLTSVCVQQFNRWARRLLTYERMPGSFPRVDRARLLGSADDINNFRRKYFEGFREADKFPH